MMQFPTRTRSARLRVYLRAGAGIGAAAMLSLAAARCSGNTTAPNAVTELDGPSVSIGSGTVHTFALRSGRDVTTLGVNISDDALTALPDTMAAWQLALPSNASVAPWDHVTLNWNPDGHEPMAIYGTPHFDFHFYSISTPQQMAIAGGADTTPVAARYVPQDYASQVIAVPQMGVHWADTLASEYHGHPFDRTFIYGFSQGRMNFVEPMITTAFLQSHPSVSAPVKQPAEFQIAGKYPRSYGVRYDAAHKSTLITLDSLAVH